MDTGNQHQIDRLIASRNGDVAIIFLSGPTSLNTPLSALRQYDTICVNGSADYLIINDITPFIYLVTDHNYFIRNTESFFHQAKAARHVVVSKELYDVAKHRYSERLSALQPIIIHRACKSKKGGLKNYLKLKLKYRNCDMISYTAPLSKKGTIQGYSRDIRLGYFHTRTVAYAGIQLTETLGYKTVCFSGLDMTGSKGRFYEQKGSRLEKTSLDEDLDNILDGLSWMKTFSKMKVFNLSNDTRVPYELVPFADSVEDTNDH